MTEEQVILEAMAFANQTGLVIGKIKSIRLVLADQIYGQGSGKSNMWFVNFEKPLPNGVAAESPSSIIIEVNDRTGEVSQFDAL
jgi:hypothetical protein